MTINIEDVKYLPKPAPISSNIFYDVPDVFKVKLANNAIIKGNYMVGSHTHYYIISIDAQYCNKQALIDLAKVVTELSTYLEE